MNVHRQVLAELVEQVLAECPDTLELMPIDFARVEAPLRRADLHPMPREEPLMVAGIEMNGMTFGHDRWVKQSTEWHTLTNGKGVVGGAGTRLLTRLQVTTK